MPETIDKIKQDGGSSWGGSNPPSGGGQNPPTTIPQWWSCDRCIWFSADQINNDQFIYDLVLPDYTYSNLAIGQYAYHDLHFYQHTEFGTWFKLNVMVFRNDSYFTVYRNSIAETNNPSGVCIYPPVNNPPSPGNPSGQPTIDKPPKIIVVNNNTGHVNIIDLDPQTPVKPTVTILTGIPNLPGLGGIGANPIPDQGGIGAGNFVGSSGNNNVGFGNPIDPDYDPCYKFISDPVVYQQCKCIHSNNTYPGCYTPPTPPDIGPKPLMAPPCPTPGHGGEFDPYSITGNDGIVRSGIAQTAATSWQGVVMVDWAPVNTLNDVDNAIINLQGNHLINTSFGIREALEKQLNISFYKDIAFNECAPNLQPKSNISGIKYLHGYLTLRYPGPGYEYTLTIRTYKKIGDSLNEYVIGDLLSDKFLYRIGPARPKITTPPPIITDPNRPVVIPVDPTQPTPRIPDPINPSKPLVPISTGKIFTNLDSPIIQRVETTYGIWSEGIGNLTTMFTCSIVPSASTAWKQSHYTIYNKKCTHKCAEPQYEVTYGHSEGSGSVDLGGFDHQSPTNAIYSQYRLLCLNPAETQFKINGKNAKHVYVINIKQDRMGDRFDEGNWELNIHHLSGSQHLQTKPVNSFTGSAVKLGAQGRILRLIDDSKVYINSSSFGGHYYNVVSGSIEDGIFNKTQPNIFGQVYPSLGIIILDANALDLSASFGTSQATDKHSDNAYKLVLAMSGAAQYTDRSGDKLGFQARRVKVNYDRYYFIRVKNSEYNYSNNPTYVTGSEGLIKKEFRDVEKVFISSIGFYDRHGNLVAVGKVSKPVLKTRTDEALFSVRLRY